MVKMASSIRFESCSIKLRSRREFEAWVQESAEVLNRRRQVEVRLEEGLPAGGIGAYLGYCWVCGKNSRFMYDRMYSRASRVNLWESLLSRLPLVLRQALAVEVREEAPSQADRVNWRESLVCVECGLTNRLRLSVQVLEELVPDFPSPRVYLTEQVTPVAAALRKRIGNLACSEFLGPDIAGGSIDSRGFRHEDLTQLSFPDAAFDVVLSFDVLEHVPNYRAALGEMRRVLRSGGSCVITAPFDCSSDPNVVRAVLQDDGEIRHLLPAEYHGDPVSPERGALCYYRFGWELLEDMKSAGFSDAVIHLSWSSDYGNIGAEQPMIVGMA
ncbi:MAG: class I SAM-dependent methyltransferase [Burkholderiales bacterium]